MLVYENVNTHMTLQIFSILQSDFSSVHNSVYISYYFESVAFQK